MHVHPEDLVRIAGKGGELFEKLVYDLIVREARRHRIPPSSIDWDHRTSVPDGGCDIVVRQEHDDPNPRFVPKRPSIWSVKSGADGVNPTTLRKEVREHPKLRDHLVEGEKYVWCALQPISQDKRAEMEGAAKTLGQEVGFHPDLIEFRWVETICNVLNEHPNLIRKHLPTVAGRRDNLLSLADWERTNRHGFSVGWIEFADRQSLKTRIREHLLARSAANVLHVAGFSGTGKTRLVLQACRDHPGDLDDILYIPELSMLTAELFCYLEEEGREARVVVDEVPLQKLQGFKDRVGDYADRLRFVTIGPAIRGENRRSASEDFVLLAEPASDAGILDVVRQEGTGLADTALRKIADVSAPDLNLAIMLVRATLREGRFDDNLRLDIADIWARVMSLFKDEIGDTDRFREQYELLTAAIDIGQARKYQDELAFLAAWFGRNLGELQIAIDKAHKCGLGIATSSFFEAKPRALARQLFEDGVWPQVRSRLPAFIMHMPSERMRRRFIERCQECRPAIREEAEKALASFFLTKLHDCEITGLAGSDESREFRTWAEMDPTRGLDWLKRAVSRATPEELAALDGGPDGSGRWRARRQIVWMCEHLACFADHFWKCEEILYTLAQLETEQSLGNNSTAVWQAMFQPVLSNTEVPFSERLELLLKRLRQANDLQIALILPAAMAIIGETRARMLPPREVGGRIVPNEWRPRTVSELQSVVKAAAQRMLSTFSDLKAPQRLIAAKECLVHLSSFIGRGLVKNVQEFFGQFSENEEIQRTLRIHLDDLIATYYFANEHSTSDQSEILESLKAWRDRMSPKGLVSRIKDLTAHSNWSAHWMSRRRTASEAEEDVRDEYEVLASELLNEPGALHELCTWFNSTNASSRRRFGNALGRLDEKGTVVHFVREWLSHGQCLEFIVGYMRGAVNRINELPEEWADDLNQAAKHYPLFVLRATLEIDVTSRGFARVMQCIGEITPRPSRLLLPFVFDFWDGVLEPGQRGSLIGKLYDLAEEGDVQATKTAFDLISMWSKGGKKPLDKESADPLLKLARRVVDCGDAVDSHDWKIGMGLLAGHEPMNTGQLLAGALTCSNLGLVHLEQETLEVLSDLARTDSKSVMTVIGQKMIDVEKQTMFGICEFRGLFEAIGLDAVKAWIDRHGREHAHWIARHVASPQVSDDGAMHVPPLTLWLLTEFEDNDEVFDAFCIGRHSGEMRWGRAGDRRGEEEAAVRPFLTHSRRRIREWAEYEMKEIRAHVAMDDEWDDERKRS